MSSKPETSPVFPFQSINLQSSAVARQEGERILGILTASQTIFPSVLFALILPPLPKGTGPTNSWACGGFCGTNWFDSYLSHCHLTILFLRSESFTDRTIYSVVFILQLDTVVQFLTLKFSKHTIIASINNENCLSLNDFYISYFFPFYNCIGLYLYYNMKNIIVAVRASFFFF